MSSILFHVKDAIGYITLHRPDKYNAFNREMALELQQVLEQCKEPDIRCVVISGSGKAFSSG
ncbi:MAG TPA: enoyl-CoA hydratase-related protein, partial [Flavisolibacter sp.]